MAAEPARTRPPDEAPATASGEGGKRQVSSPSSGPNPVDLDRLIHGRVRLGIVSALAVHEVLSFPELKELLDTSDGNLSVHARRLEEGGYVTCSKSFEGRVPRTEYRLTREGRQALGRYLDHMEALIGRVREP
jgi:DNA-binding HxlR family transcriptional regulator